MLVLERQEAAMATSLELSGCYVVTTDVLSESMSTQEVHDSYVGRARFSRHEDRAIGSTAIVRAQGESHARPRVLLHAGIKTES